MKRVTLDESCVKLLYHIKDRCGLDNSVPLGKKTIRFDKYRAGAIRTISEDDFEHLIYLCSDTEFGSTSNYIDFLLDIENDVQSQIASYFYGKMWQQVNVEETKRVICKIAARIPIYEFETREGTVVKKYVKVCEE